MERWDVLDKDRNFKGRTHKRGEALKQGDYHLIVQVWIITDDGKILLTKRSEEKVYPNVWEITAGSAITGDDSITAALREVKEETGITLNPNNGNKVYTYGGSDFFMDVWVFEQNVRIKDVVLQQGETCDAQLATLDEVKALMDAEEFIPIFGYRTRIFEQIKEIILNLPQQTTVTSHAIGTFKHNQLKFAVIIAKHKDKWVLVNHQDRNTWEIPGGHIEKDEHVDDTAKRELFEETGATAFDIKTICDYSVKRGKQQGYGRLYFADIKTLGKLPDLEIEKIALFEELPENLTYPIIQPALLQLYLKA